MAKFRILCALVDCIRPIAFITSAVVTINLAAATFCLGWKGLCVGVHDGDSLTVLRQKKPVKVRLHGIDCPELDQAFGIAAKRFTREMAYHRILKVDIVSRDFFGRTIAMVYSDGMLLNHELLKAGMAWWFRKSAVGPRITAS